MFHPATHFHESPGHPVPGDALRATDYPSDLTDSCCVAPSSSSDDDDDDDDDHGLDDQLEDPFASSAPWDDYQISESIRRNVLPLFRTSPLSSSLDSSSSSDCSTSVLKPPPSILRFEHYSSSATKFFFDVDGDDEHGMEEDQVEEDDSHSSGNWIQEQLQVPLLHHEYQHKQQFMVDDCRKNEANRDIMWSPPLPLRSRSFASKKGLARDDELICQHAFSTLGIQPMSSCSESHCDFDCRGSHDKKNKSVMKTPSTASSATTATPNPKRHALDISLRPMAIWVPTVVHAQTVSSLHHVDDVGHGDGSDDDDDVSTLTHDEQYQPPWLPKTVKGSYDLVESDLLLLLEKERATWRQRQQQRQRQRYDRPRKPNLQVASPTSTTRDVWTNHDLDWLTDEEDSLSTLTAAMSNSCSSWYDDDDDEEDEC